MFERLFGKKGAVEAAAAEVPSEEPAVDLAAIVAGWASGRARIASDGSIAIAGLPDDDVASKVRRAYDWIVEHAIVCENPDLELGDPIVLRADAGMVELRRSGGYASYVLLPLLGLVTGARVLFIGAPGRGKTTVATLMGLLAGDALEDVRRGTQRGHPQLTVSDLLGSPLPGDLVRAADPSEIRVAWRGWLTRRVKIVDELNRLPTKTQSALLSLMAEGCAEMYEQVVHTGKSAWYLTANDELGGGTFQVITALEDRIDCAVRALPLEPRHVGILEERVRRGRSPEEDLPGDIVLSHEELDRAEDQIRAVPVSAEALAALGTFSAQVEFCRRASDRIEHMSKDTLHVAGHRLAHVCNEDCPLDKLENVCSQTESGVSTRAQLSLLMLAKAFAWFRGAEEATTEDLRLLIPWVMHQRLRPNAHSAFFQKDENRVLMSDRAGWVRAAFDRAVAHAAAHRDRRGEIEAIEGQVELAMAGGRADTARQQLVRVERAIEGALARSELNALVHEDLLRLRALHARCRRHIERAGPA